jgi:membrane protein implicated in regulation of membrane protease activity
MIYITYYIRLFVWIKERRKKGMNLNMYIVWAAAIIAFGILEGITAQLVSIWFVAGAIAALISVPLHAPQWLQFVIFFAVSLIVLAATRPFIKKKLTPKQERTNADRCIGKDAVVTEEINNLLTTGAVRADGKVWTARSSDDSIIPKDAVVTVEKIDGVKLIVKNKM